ncbi:MAG: DEAD/DEAH box helicase [Proteobacteria bacterium]|nr:DEAD/DEAH box helicase [Pseudomonadota bacterium]
MTSPSDTRLRDYQQRAITLLYRWFEAGNTGHPCIELPTGSGKSHIIAELCRDAIQTWPETRILMLTHVKELIEQNAEKMRQHWPNAPLGIYSAGLRSKQLDAITFAGIQSVREKSALIGHIDLVIVDECHLISHNAEGGYRTLISELIQINPALRVIGMTATPYRLGHGLITDSPALFSAILRPTSIEELIFKGFLAPLRSKLTAHKLSVEGVHKRGGEYIESELQDAVDKKEINGPVVDEIISQAGDRKSWLVFCVGVKHSYNIRNELRERGITAATITGETPKNERAEIIAGFKAGRIRALTNANVLTTGFDHPNIDLIALLRKTASPGLYCQMAGRGMRPKSHTDHCRVLDFAGVVEEHGPITNIDPGRKAGEGDAPVKVCEACNELNHISARECVACGEPFPEPKPTKQKLHDDDIMGLDTIEMNVTEWQWRRHISRVSGKEMLMVTYYGALSDKPVNEYLTVMHDGYAGQKARILFAKISNHCGSDADMHHTDLTSAAREMNECAPPGVIKFRQDGKFYRVTDRRWG